MQLPYFQSSIPEMNLLQTKWASIINPVLSNVATNPTILQNISVVSGNNVINHKLGATPIGWVVIDSNAGVTLYRNAPFNNLTLTLHSSGSAVISLMVF